MLKLWLRRIHLLLAIFSGLFLISSSITGALLIYAKDIQHQVTPGYWQIKSQHKPVDLSQLISQVEAQTEQQVTIIEPAPEPNLAWQLRLANKLYLSVDPYTANILLKYDYYETFYGFTMAFHRWLLFKDKDGNYPLRLLVSVATLCLMIEILLGFYLWARPKNRIKRLKINKKAKPKILFYQLHTVIGVYLCLPLLLIAFSGIAFYWKNQTSSVVETVTFSEIEERPQAPIVKAQPKTQRQLSLALEHGLKALPEAKLYRIYMAKKPTESMALRMKMPDESHAYSWVWINPYTAQVLQIYDASQASVATQVWNFKYKFHIGDFAGPLVQILWLILALTPLFFVLSGLYLWYCRHRKNIR